jgi:hypothetical protein
VPNEQSGTFQRHILRQKKRERKAEKKRQVKKKQFKKERNLVIGRFFLYLLAMKYLDEKFSCGFWLTSV